MTWPRLFPFKFLADMENIPDPKANLRTNIFSICAAETAVTPHLISPSHTPLHFIEIPRKIHGIKGLFFYLLLSFISFEVRPLAASFICLFSLSAKTFPVFAPDFSR